MTENSNHASLEGKKILITGAVKRLGLEIACHLSSCGARLALHYKDSSHDQINTAVEQVARHGKSSPVVLQADLADRQQVANLFAQAHDQLGGIDGLINNASVFPPSRLGSLDPEELERTMQINAWAPLALVQAMAATGKPGAVVNLIDQRVENIDLEHAAYHLSKLNLAHITQMTAAAFAPRLRVNAVCPGPILPPPGLEIHHMQKSISQTLLKKRGYPADIARAVEFLLREEFITGQLLNLDGGQRLTPRII